MDNVAAVGEGEAQYVEMQEITDGVMALASPALDHRPDPSDCPARAPALADGAPGQGGPGDRRGAAAGPRHGPGLAERGMTVAIHHHESAAGARELRRRSSPPAGGPPASSADLTDADAAASPAATGGRPAGRPRRAGQLGGGHAAACVWRRPRRSSGTRFSTSTCARSSSVPRAPRRRSGAARGKVVNLADLAGLEPWPGFAAHSISKAGVVMLTKVLALSLAPEVTVNAIAPGAVLVPEDY